MFGFGKGKNKKPKKGTATKPGAKAGIRPDGQKMSREEIIAEAMANARKATDEIGEENIQRMAAALRKLEKEEQSPGGEAINRVRKMDKDEVAACIRSISRED